MGLSCGDLHIIAQHKNQGKMHKNLLEPQILHYDNFAICCIVPSFQSHVITSV